MNRAQMPTDLQVGVTKGFTHGLAWAIEFLNRVGEAALAEQLYGETGLTLADFVAQGIDGEDMAAVLKASAIVDAEKGAVA